MSLPFNDTTADKNGLIQECESLVFGDYGRISGDPQLLATFTRYMNQAMNRIATLIMTADSRWQFDDTNQTDFPIGTTALVSGQKDYTFPVSAIRITRVEVKDSSGNWHLLNPIDQADVYDQSLTDFLKSTGLPSFYDKQATSVFLYPSPSYSQSDSLKIYFQRPPTYFSVSDTIEVPGFNSMYHRLVSLIASRDYAVTKQMSVAKDLSALVQQQEDSLIENYLLRSKDEHTRLTVRQNKFN